MIDIFMEATDFINIFEKNQDAEEDNKDTLYWERVFANATCDAHKLFKS